MSFNIGDLVEVTTGKDKGMKGLVVSGIPDDIWYQVDTERGGCPLYTAYNLRLIAGRVDAESHCEHDDTWEDGVSRFCTWCGGEIEHFDLTEDRWVEGTSQGKTYAGEGWL